MSEHDNAKQFAQRGAAMARDVIEEGKQGTEDSARIGEESYSATLENMQQLQIKLIDIAQANAEAAFDFSRQIATAKTPSQIAQLWTEHAQKHIKMLNTHTQELTALGQKMASASVAPMLRSAKLGMIGS